MMYGRHFTGNYLSYNCFEIECDKKKEESKRKQPLIEDPEALSLNAMALYSVSE